MKYFFLVVSRYFWTVFCKISAKAAEKTKFSWTISLMDFFLKKHGKALGNEAVYCMNQVREWQEKAKKCVLAHHQFEKFITPGEKK